MEIVNVIVAAAASYIFGAVWYMALAKPWMEAAKIEVGDDGRPLNASNPVPYITAFVAAIIVAGMMRHIFALSGIDTVGKGLVSGFGIGAFLVVPWIATHYGFGGKPRKLLLIDGAYATIGCTIIGTVLNLF